jgi:hypothetical protein
MNNVKEFELKQAQVISVNEASTKGGIRIKILPELKDVPDDKCPIAYPFFSFNSANELSNDMPEENSIIRVLVNSYYTLFYYLPNQIFPALFDYTLITTKLGDASEISGTDYKDLKFRMYRDGALEFHNKDTGEHGIIHSSGSYMVMDESGNIIVNGGSNKLKIYNDAINLKEILDDIQGIIKNIITPSNLIDGEGRPVTYSQVGTDLPLIIQDETKISNLLEDT